MSNYISYSDLLKSRDQFRKSGTSGGSDFNLYDTPGHKYFKLFFYFNNEDSDGSGMDNGLLSPTWLEKNLSEKTYYMYNSAWSYLKMNAEDDRADLLEKFINLLSNINSESPWYFSEMSGLDAAMERKQVMADNFALEAARPKITIKCLPDAFDDRISSLLDMYRSIVWDWRTKREVLPANLRKFDMGILIFETANAPFHMRKYADINNDADYALVLGNEQTQNRTSYKYIELHNCEIDYGSSKALYSALNNKEGFSPEYNIDIHFDDCYESRFNEFAVSEFGDCILKLSDTESSDSNNNQKINRFLANATAQLVATGASAVNSLLKKAVLGNLYKFSLTRIGNQLKQLASGDVISTVRNAQEYIRDYNQRNPKLEQVGGDMFPPTGYVMGQPKGNMFEKKKIKPSVKYIGNMFEGGSIANNL